MTINEACFLLMLCVKIKYSENVLILNMGKQIKIFDVINNLIKIKKKLNKNYNYKIKKIGLKSGEKMNEELSISKKLKNTKIKDIKMASDPLYKKYEIFNLIEFLENNKDVIKKIKKIKYFLNKELKILS